MQAQVPSPVTREEEFLAAILAELRVIRRKLGRRDPQRPSVDEGDAIEVELREPRKRGKG